MVVYSNLQWQWKSQCCLWYSSSIPVLYPIFCEKEIKKKRNYLQDGSIYPKIALYTSTWSQGRFLNNITNVEEIIIY